jgi:phenylacetate-CoA ligase
MIAQVVDRGLRTFEAHNVSPTKTRQAARLLNLLVRRGLDASLVRKIQTQRLAETVDYAYQHSPFYEKVLDRAGVRPNMIRAAKDLQRLPFTTSDDLREWREFLCVPQDRLANVYTTAGTTGEPKRVYFTWRETQMLTNLGAVTLRIGHKGPLVTLIALPMRHGLWLGWNSALRVVERADGLALPVGADDLVSTLRWMQRFEPNVLISSPSYLTALTREAENQGYQPSIDRILLGGEKSSGAQRARFTAYWGAAIFDSYGMTEIGGAQTIMLPECCAFHLNQLLLVTEIIDPETLEPAEEGELVFTTLRRQAMPLLRYRSGDRGRWADCSCWLPFRAFRFIGRIDDMVVAGDMNLYGNVMAEAIADILGTSGRIEIRTDKEGLADRLLLRVEGTGVSEQEVREVLFETYPVMRTNIANDILVLEIEVNADLRGQIKAVKILDRR